MSMRRTLSLILIACIAAAVVPAAAGAAVKKPRSAKFLVSADGIQVTEWDAPRQNLYYDCQGQRWNRGRGSEIVSFRTKKVRALITLWPGRQPDVKFGTWDRFAQSKQLKGPGKVERIGEMINGIDPDERCWDGGPTEQNTGPYDCGNRKTTVTVSLRWTDRLGLDTLATPYPIYKNCPIMSADGVDDAAITDGILSYEKLDPRDLFARKFKYHEILGGEDFTETTSWGRTSNTKVRWTMRFQRVK